MNTQLDQEGDIIGSTSADSTKPSKPPLMDGNVVRESGNLTAVGSTTFRFRRNYKKSLLVFDIIIICSLFLIGVDALGLHRKKVKLCESTECLRSAANLALSMDPSADPCDNFYQYACGNWGSEHLIPDSFYYNTNFLEKTKKVNMLVRDFLNGNVSNQPKPVQQAKDLYDACMDTDTLNERGLNPLIIVLKSLGLPPYPTYINITEDFDYSTYTFDWLETVIKIKTHLGKDVLIGFGIDADPKNSSVNRMYIGAPPTVYAFRSTNIKTERQRHNGRTLNTRKHFIEDKSSIYHEIRRTNESDDAAKDVDNYAKIMKLFALESENNTKLTDVDLDKNFMEAASEYYKVKNDIRELTEYNSTQTDEEDYSNNAEYTVDELQHHTDSIVELNNGTATPIWRRYLEGLFSISTTELDFEKDKILIADRRLNYMSMLAAFVSRTPPAIMELYIWMQVVRLLGDSSPTKLRDLTVGKELHYQSKQVKCVETAIEMFGMAMSYGIADPNLFNVTKPKVSIMVDELKDSFAHLVGQAKWMDEDTKSASYQKITNIKPLLGFPDNMLEDGKLEEYYSGIVVDPKKLLENMLNINKIEFKKSLNELRNKNNVTWEQDPIIANAFYQPNKNSIIIPMVMLQHPFFNLGLDSLNYGALGTVLGHEINHGFDNTGRRYDKNGNKVQWWSNSSISTYVNMTQCFIDQYSGYYVPELDDHIDGNNVLGEVLADNGGLRTALAALRHHLKKHGPEQKLPGFEHLTSEQLFFLAMGNLWCEVTTKEYWEIVRGLVQDVHPPSNFRVIGAMQNSQDFARAWRCPPGSNMNPAKKCIIF